MSGGLIRVVALFGLAMLGLAGATYAQPAAPLQAVLVFVDPPADLTYDGVTPVKITLQLRNVSGGPVITTAGFSGTDFWRQLAFTLDGVGIITNAELAGVHRLIQFGTCHYRGGALLAGEGLPVLPVEVLPADFALEFAFDDAGTHFDLTRAGRYRVTATVSLLAYEPGAIISDCDIEFGSATLLNIGEKGTVGRQEFEIVSNSLEFVIQPADSVPPVTTSAVTPPANGAGWQSGNAATVTLTAADNAGGAGVKQIAASFFGAQADAPQTISGASAVIPITAEGVTTVFYNAEDNAGNKEEIKSETVRLDQTAPVVTPPDSISVDATEAGGARGRASPALAAFLAGGTAVDNLDPAPARLTAQVNGKDVSNDTLFPTGDTTVVFRFQDQAGNIGSGIAGVRVGQATGDRIPPTTTATPTVGPKSVTVVLTAQDNPGGTGVQQISYMLSGRQTGSAVVAGSSATVVITAKGVTTLSYFATDKAGNQESAKTLTVQNGGPGKTSCTGSLTGTIHDLIVPDKAACTLSVATVTGKIDVKRDASLAIGPLGASVIHGDLEVDHCRAVTLAGNVKVEGNVRIRHCAQDSGYTGPGIQIDGDFECRDNAGACRAVNGSLKGDVRIENNKSTSPSEISGNSIRGTLRCQGNAPAPTHTASNTARKKEGQCDAKLGF